MKDLKGTKTEANLMAAFAGESQARNKYTYYASKAKKEGYEQIAALFLETANNEKEHAKIWFKLLHGGEMPDTMANLKDARTEKTMNGQICMQKWLSKQEKKALTILHSYLKKLVKLKNTMKKDIASYYLTLKKALYSQETGIPFGNAQTAVIL